MVVPYDLGLLIEAKGRGISLDQHCNARRPLGKRADACHILLLLQSFCGPLRGRLQNIMLTLLSCRWHDGSASART